MGHSSHRPRHGSAGRSSGASGSHASRKRPVPEASAAGTAAESGPYVGPPSITQQRSKRPKLQVQPSRASMGAAAEPKSEFKTCRKLLAELMRHRSCGPFLKPVDPNLYPDYYTIVTDPMDLGTIKKRVDNSMYTEPDEFESDLGLVWSNCYLYNGENSEVAKMAKELEMLSATRLRDMPLEAKASEGDAMKAMKKQMAQMQKQLQMAMQSQLMNNQMMMLQQPAAPMAPAPNKRNSTGGGRRPSLPPAYPMVPAAQEEARDMSFEEKQQLSAGINKLSSNNLTKVVKIIKTNMPSLGHGGDEIEVDLAALDNTTLWKLQHFVDSCNATKKKPKQSKSTAAEKQQMLAQAQYDAEQNLARIEGGSKYAAGNGSYNTGGLQLQQGAGASGRYADSPSDSDSDGDMGAAVSGGGGGGGSSSGLWADFQNTKKQRDQEREAAQRRERERQAAQRAEEDRARERAESQAQARKREIERQRAREREMNAGSDGELDMLGQSNMMASFEGGY